MTLNKGGNYYLKKNKVLLYKSLSDNALRDLEVKGDNSRKYYN